MECDRVFPKAGQHDIVGVEAQPEKVPTPGFAALLFTEEAKPSSQGAVQEKQRHQGGR